MDRLKVIEAGGVSIHAPAGGATVIDAQELQLHALFQSTRPRGARLYC